MLLFMQPVARGGSAGRHILARMTGPRLHRGGGEADGSELLQGLDVMQRLGYVHRDIKARRVNPCLPASAVGNAGRHAYTRRTLMSRWT